METKPQPSREVAFLLDQLERSMYGGAWHGPAVLEALDGIEPERAADRLAGAAHTIWELALHIGAWLKIARRRIEGDPAACCPTPEEDFPPAPEPSLVAWQEALAGLEENHRALRCRLRDMEDPQLESSVTGSDPTVRGLLLGILQHNSYHAGQIVLLKKALNEERRPG